MALASARQRTRQHQSATTDPRAIRTRETIVATFARMLVRNAPSDITVADLTDASAVSRSAFYRHFDSPDAVAAEAIHQVLAHMSDHARSLRVTSDMSGRAIAVQILVDVAELLGRDPLLYGRLLTVPTNGAVHPAFVDVLSAGTLQTIELLRTDLTRRQRGAIAAAVGAGLAHSLVDWLKDGARTSADEFVQTYMLSLPEWLISERPPSITNVARDARASGESTPSQ